LTAYRDAGAEVMYAPGIRTAEEILEVVALGRPVNVLARPGVPTVAELAEHGVRRVSTGGALARAAYDTLEATTASLRPRLGPDGHGSEAHAPQRRR
jgi:2-methylisocitrate lyase-like PEP mutase family enzyme